MWYECLPSALIVATLLYVPQIAGKFFNEALLGNAYRRDLNYKYGRWMFWRDCRLDGLPWKIRGLEQIPDE